MGCCHVNEQTECINEVFSKIPIRNVSMTSFLSNFIENTPITQTKFQVIINDYLLLNDERLYSNHRIVLFDYWYEMYNELQSKTRCQYLKFMLGLLCKKGRIEQDAILLDECLTMKEGVIKEKGNGKYITKSTLKNVLKHYIQLITIDTIKHFKYFSINPESFQSHLENEWEYKAIDGFIDEEFNESLPKDNSSHNLIRGTDFFINNLDKLKDDEMLREKFKEYSKRFRHNNQKLLEINELITGMKCYY